MNALDDENRHTNTAAGTDARALVPYDLHNDEIDLIDLGASLWRRWKLMLSVFLACVAVALLFAFLTPRSYEYTTTVEIGSQVTGTQIQPIESSGSAASKLENGYLREALNQYSQKHGVNPEKFTFNVKQPDKANLVIISGKGSIAQAESYMAIEKAAADLLVASDARIIKNQEAQLTATLAQAQAKLDQLKDPANQQLLKSQVDDLQSYQKLAQRQQIVSSRAGGGANTALTLLLLGNQAQQANQQLLSLGQQVNNLTSDIESQAVAVQSLKTQLGNLQMTRIVAGPMRSIKHVGMGRSAMVAIGAVFGIVLAIMVALGSDYLFAVRERIAQNAGD